MEAITTTKNATNNNKKPKRKKLCAEMPTGGKGRPGHDWPWLRPAPRCKESSAHVTSARATVLRVRAGHSAPSRSHVAFLITNAECKVFGDYKMETNQKRNKNMIINKIIHLVNIPLLHYVICYPRHGLWQAVLLSVSLLLCSLKGNHPLNCYAEIENQIL